MKKNVFIVTVILFGIIAFGALIPSMTGLMIFGPDIGKSSYVGDANNYIVSDGEIDEVGTNEGRVSYIIVKGSPTKKCIFAVGNEEIVQSGLSDILQKGVAVRIATIEAPSPDMFYIVSLSHGDREYIDTEKSIDAIIDTYKDIDRQATVWLSISCSIMCFGIIGLITVIVIYKTQAKTTRPARATKNNIE